MLSIVTNVTTTRGKQSVAANSQFSMKYFDGYLMSKKLIFSIGYFKWRSLDIVNDYFYINSGESECYLYLEGNKICVIFHRAHG